MDKKTKILTTGEVAEYCHVHFRTVIRWIEKGRLKGYKLPGRGNNRIEQKDFIQFLIDNNMPIPKELDEKNNRVLIVDDEKEMASAINRVFISAGYQPQIAHNGFQAGNMLSEFQPALITLDLNMPGIDGFEVLKFIQLQQSAKPKVIVISAMDESDLKKAKQAGADICMAKPFDRKELMAVAAELMNDKKEANI